MTHTIYSDGIGQLTHFYTSRSKARRITIYHDDTGRVIGLEGLYVEGWRSIPLKMVRIRRAAQVYTDACIKAHHTALELGRTPEPNEYGTIIYPDA